MRIIFFGTGKFALPSFKKLLNSEHDIIAVVTQPDTRRGRGWNLIPTPIKAVVEKAVPGMEIFQPGNVSDPGFLEHMKALKAEVFVVVDYGQYLVKELMDIPAKYSINLHPSLLPKYRGAAPVNRAILEGESETGNTVIKLSGKMDAGDIILQSAVKIDLRETAPELLERLSQTGAELLVKALDMIGSGDVRLERQDETRVSYAPKLQKKDGEVNWNDDAEKIIRQIRAMQPWPGVFTHAGGKMLKIFEAQAVPVDEENVPPGTLLDENKFIVKTGKDAVRVNILQIEGKKRMTAREFIRGHKLIRGSKLD